MSHREVEATITVRFRVPSEAGHAQGEHFHFADFPLDATVKEVYEHVGRRILPVELQGELDRVDLLVEAYADGPMIKLQRSTKVPLGKLPFCAGGLCSVECHMPSGFSRARTAAANVSARNQNTGVSYVPSARDEAQSYVQRFVPAAVSFDVQHEVSHEQQQQQRNARADERHISQRGPTVSVAAEEPTKHEEQMVSIGTRNLSAHEQIAQDITVTRSLNAALGREIDSLGEKMAYYTNAQGAMEDRRTALKNELALIRRLLKQSEVDCAQCEQNCDKLHQARNKSQHQSDRSRQSLAVAEKKLQTETRKFEAFFESVERVREARDASEARLAVKRAKLEKILARNARLRQDLAALKAENETYVSGERNQRKVINQLEIRMKKFMASNAHLLNRVKEIESIQIPGE